MEWAGFWIGLGIFLAALKFKGAIDDLAETIADKWEQSLDYMDEWKRAELEAKTETEEDQGTSTER